MGKPMKLESRAGDFVKKSKENRLTAMLRWLRVP